MQEDNISCNNFENCLKCNICTQVCPMMSVNPSYPGPKQAGPDGERYRLKDPDYYDKALKYCLNCKRCEVACPSSVRVGDIIQNARLKYGRTSRPLRDFALSHTDLMGSLASPVANVVNAALSLDSVGKIMNAVGVDRRKTFPKYSHMTFEKWFRKMAPDQSRFSRYVSYFHGCYVNYNYPALGKDTVMLLNACGYGVKLLDKEKCCGVALLSNGFENAARKNADINLSSMRRALSSSEAVLTSSSTCTFTMRDEYEHILHIDNSDVRSHLMLVTKWIYDCVESGKVKLVFKKDWTGKVAYHTACHMGKLGWSFFSISLLRMIPGMELIALPQECCGIAGTFGFKTENYEFTQKIGSPLFDLIRESGADYVSTDCETCKWQIEMNTSLQVLNPISILAAALDYDKTYELNNGRTT